MNTVDLGRVYRLDVVDTRVQLDLTMVSPACPMGEGILDEVEATLRSDVRLRARYRADPYSSEDAVASIFYLP